MALNTRAGDKEFAGLDKDAVDSIKIVVKRIDNVTNHEIWWLHGYILWLSYTLLE